MKQENRISGCVNPWCIIMTALATAELDDATAADDTVPEAAVPAIIPGPTDIAVSLCHEKTAFGSR